MREFPEEPLTVILESSLLTRPDSNRVAVPSGARAVQIISSNTDDNFVACKYTCRVEGALRGCGATTIKFGEPSEVLDVSWVESVESAVCFRSALDPTVSGGPFYLWYWHC